MTTNIPPPSLFPPGQCANVRELPRVLPLYWTHTDPIPHVSTSLWNIIYGIIWLPQAGLGVRGEGKDEGKGGGKGGKLISNVKLIAGWEQGPEPLISNIQTTDGPDYSDQYL